MLRGYRSIVVALVGLVLLAATVPPKSATQPNQAATKSGRNTDVGRIATALEKLPQAENPDAGCQQGSDDRKSDLCAQWKAADAAFDSATWTQRTFWLGIIGAAIGFLTLAAAAFAAWWAKAAATETAKGSKAAQDAVSSGRAWLLPEKPTIAHFKNTTIHGMGRVADGLGFSMAWQNYGQSPALDCKFYRQILVLPQGAAVPVFEPDYSEVGAGTVIAQGAMIGDKIAALNDDNTKAFRDQAVSVFFYSSVIYKETFHPTETRQSAFCVEIQHGGGTSSINDGKPQEAISFLHVGNQNCAD